MRLETQRIDRIIRFALKEDIGAEDMTSAAVTDRFFVADAVIISRDEGIVCGLSVAERVFAAVDSSLRFRPSKLEGQRVHPGEELAFVEGPAYSIMKAERTALNYLGFLSGIATSTRRMVDLVEGTRARIYDTRKTIPLQRYLQKYAVSCGGGYNHRMGLWDMVLIKDNHIRAYSMQARNSDNEQVIRGVIRRARSSAQKNARIEIEVENLKECQWALDERPDIVLLDNFPPEKVRNAVMMRRDMNAEEVLLEASGGIDKRNVAEYASTGVERISVGSITSDITPVDYSLRIIYRHG